MRGVMLAILLLSVALSGCIQSEVPDRAQELPPDAASVLPWGLTECRYVVAWGWVDGDRLSPLLPDGFSVRRSSPPLAAADGADTLFGADAMVCASGRGLNDTIAPIHYGYLWAAADPPAAYLQDGVDPDEHYAKWDVLVPDTERRTYLEARGVPAHDGDASVADTPLGPDARLMLDTVGPIRLQGLGARPLGAFDGSFVKASTATDGAAMWRAHAVSGPRVTGNALLTFPEGSWMAEVIGDTTLRGGYHSGTWSYEDAQVAFVQQEI